MNSVLATVLWVDSFGEDTHIHTHICMILKSSTHLHWVQDEKEVRQDLNDIGLWGICAGLGMHYSTLFLGELGEQPEPEA